MVERNYLKLTAKQQAERKDALIAWLEEGYRIEDFAASIDRDVSTVRKFMKTHGIEKPKSP